MNGRELRFDGDIHNIANDIWYPSVSYECLQIFNKKFNNAFKEDFKRFNSGEQCK